jgi:hypothetical protein
VAVNWAIRARSIRGAATRSALDQIRPQPMRGSRCEQQDGLAEARAGGKGRPGQSERGTAEQESDPRGAARKREPGGDAEPEANGQPERKLIALGIEQRFDARREVAPKGRGAGRDPTTNPGKGGGHQAAPCAE